MCLTAEETLRYVMREGSKNLKGKYVIGYWPWEYQDGLKVGSLTWINEIWFQANIQETLYPLRQINL